MARLTVMLTLVFLGVVMPAWAVDYYLDPDWTGTKSGTQAQPFATIGATEWTTINTALASGDVNIYCSARDAGSDTDQVWDFNIALTSKTSNPTGTLRLYGQSVYNTNDSTPSWTAYTGTSRCQVQGFNSQGSLTKRSKVEIDGFHIIQNNGTKGITICGDNWIIRNNELENGAASANQPLIQVVPTSDVAHEGSSQPCSDMSNVTIEDNNIHDSWAEMLYMGAGGCNGTSDALTAALDPSRCQGEPTHHDFIIQNNIFANCGAMAGGQGDCIDMKAAWKNVTIKGNDISASGNNTRPIVGQGIQTDETDQNILIERNYIHDNPTVDDAALAIVGSWGTPNGYTVRNNIFDSNSSGPAIHIYVTQSAGAKLYNNTIYNNSGLCMSSNSGSTVEVRNNACLANNGGGAQVSLSGTITSTNNAYGGTWSAACTNCVSGLTSAAFTDAPNGDFTLTSGSVLKDVGITIASFANDYLGTTRPQGSAWDIGAAEFPADAPAASVALSPAIWVGSLGAITGTMIENFLVPFLSTAAALIVAILVWEARGTILGILRFVVRLIMFPILLLVPPVQRLTRKYLLRMAWTVLSRPSTTPPPEQPQPAREPDAPRPSDPGEKHEHGLH